MAQPHLERFTPSTKLNPTYVLANVQPPPTGRVWKNLEPSPTRVGGEDTMLDQMLHSVVLYRHTKNQNNL